MVLATTENGEILPLIIIFPEKHSISLKSPNSNRFLCDFTRKRVDGRRKKDRCDTKKEWNILCEVSYGY